MGPILLGIGIFGFLWVATHDLRKRLKGRIGAALTKIVSETSKVATLTLIGLYGAVQVTLLITSDTGRAEGYLIHLVALGNGWHEILEDEWWPFALSLALLLATVVLQASRFRRAASLLPVGRLWLSRISVALTVISFVSWGSAANGEINTRANARLVATRDVVRQAGILTQRVYRDELAEALLQKAKSVLPVSYGTAIDLARHTDTYNEYARTIRLGGGDLRALSVGDTVVIARFRTPVPNFVTDPKADTPETVDVPSMSEAEGRLGIANLMQWIMVEEKSREKTGNKSDIADEAELRSSIVSVLIEKELSKSMRETLAMHPLFGPILATASDLASDFPQPTVSQLLTYLKSRGGDAAKSLRDHIDGVLATTEPHADVLLAATVQTLKINIDAQRIDDDYASILLDGESSLQRRIPQRMASMQSKINELQLHTDIDQRMKEGWAKLRKYIETAGGQQLQSAYLSKLEEMFGYLSPNEMDFIRNNTEHRREFYSKLFMILPPTSRISFGDALIQSQRPETDEEKNRRVLLDKRLHQITR